MENNSLNRTKTKQAIAWGNKIGTVTTETPHEMVLWSIRYLLSEVEKERTLRLAAEAKIAVDAGKVDLAEQILEDWHEIDMVSFVKVLNGNGINMHVARLLEKLRADGYLTGNNEPHQKWKERGLFAVARGICTAPDGEQFSYSRTLITPRGQRHLLRKYGRTINNRKDKNNG